MSEPGLAEHRSLPRRMSVLKAPMTADRNTSPVTLLSATIIVFAIIPVGRLPRLPENLEWSSVRALVVPGAERTLGLAPASARIEKSFDWNSDLRLGGWVSWAAQHIWVIAAHGIAAPQGVPTAHRLAAVQGVARRPLGRGDRGPMSSPRPLGLPRPMASRSPRDRRRPWGCRSPSEEEPRGMCVCVVFAAGPPRGTACGGASFSVRFPNSCSPSAAQRPA